MGLSREVESRLKAKEAESAEVGKRTFTSA